MEAATEADVDAEGTEHIKAAAEEAAAPMAYDFGAEVHKFVPQRGQRSGPCPHLANSRRSMASRTRSAWECKAEVPRERLARLLPALSGAEASEVEGLKIALIPRLCRAAAGPVS